jgi:hypothetical protein
MGLAAHPDRAKIEEFRRREIEARLTALTMQDAFIRRSWEVIAESYHDLANRLEQKSRT